MIADSDIFVGFVVSMLFSIVGLCWIMGLSFKECIVVIVFVALGSIACVLIAGLGLLLIM